VNVLFAGGGSGGHLYPALAIARAMVTADSRVVPFFIGAERGIERTILPETEFEYELLNLHPLYRSQPWRNWRTIMASTGSWRRITRIAAERSPRALVATGGYAAGIALGVAAKRRIPIVIQDQNSVPGLTVRWFAPRAAQLHLGFPEAARALRLGSRTQVFYSGNPIAPPPPLNERPSKLEAVLRWGFADTAAPVLLVFGGSQGAEAINRVVAKWLARTGKEIRVIWATGPANFGKYARYERGSVRVVPYISDMASAYCATDLALTRAGAMTTAELSAWGIPTILVPLPTAAADHQTHNARAIAEAGAAVMIQQEALTPESLGAMVTQLATDAGMRNEMREKTLMRARPDAAQDIAAKILEMDCFK
jgi:UDP-N-acetylglucosamine--N-acetylmuramyl-(pentapeptide) pyrophosphoryl-undecaprenol N-acetylglucosamine transferase